MSAREGPEVAWKAIEQGAVVIGSDGEEIGTVTEIAGDPQADIFSGLVISISRLGHDRFLPAERVTGIWPSRVETSISNAQAEQLGDFEATVEERLEPQDDFFTRILRRLGLFDRRPRD